MKIAVSSKEKHLESDIDSVFGRCSYFIFANIEDGKVESFEAVKNEFSDRAGGAGISAAKMVAEKGVKAIIANNIGPRALSVLNQFEIKMFSAKGSVKKAIQDLSSGKLEEFK